MKLEINGKCYAYMRIKKLDTRKEVSMGLFDFIFKKNNRTTQERFTPSNFHTPRYCTGLSWVQDSNQSITTEDGLYDLNKFSKHEVDTIKYVLNEVEQKYPFKYRSLGFANESYSIKYKARYVLFDMIIVLYGQSAEPLDKFAVSLAYASKGWYFRKQAIDYFEQSIDRIGFDVLKDFMSYMPLHVCSMFSELYEQEHDYQKAIFYTEKAKIYGDANNPYFDNRIKTLMEKQAQNPTKRNRKISESKQKFESDVRNATNHFIQLFELK